MKYTRFFSDEEGKTHIEEVEVEVELKLGTGRSS